MAPIHTHTHRLTMSIGVAHTHTPCHPYCASSRTRHMPGLSLPWRTQVLSGSVCSLTGPLHGLCYLLMCHVKIGYVGILSMCCPDTSIGQHSCSVQLQSCPGMRRQSHLKGLLTTGPKKRNDHASVIHISIIHKTYNYLYTVNIHLAYIQQRTIYLYTYSFQTQSTSLAQVTVPSNSVCSVQIQFTRKKCIPAMRKATDMMLV